MFTYIGDLTVECHGKEVLLHNVLLAEECEMTGLRSWGGGVRVPGMLYGLLDILGEEVNVILPDGRTGKAWATGYAEDSAWVVELQGVGAPPEHH